MTPFAIPLWETPTVPVVGGRPFPVRRIFCVGRNYAAHAREMGHDPDREPPFFFTKAADAIAPGHGDVAYPPATADLHPELEMVVALAKGGRDIDAAGALDCVFGYGVGIDMTRRDMQAEAKQLRRPWDLSKGFDQGAPCAPLHPVSAVGHVERGTIRLKVNGATRQEADLADMIWNVPEMIAFLSGLITLQPGDLIFSGTPEGVSAVVRGDRLEGHVDGLTDLDITMV